MVYGWMALCPAEPRCYPPAILTPKTTPLRTLGGLPNEGRLRLELFGGRVPKPWSTCIRTKIATLGGHAVSYRKQQRCPLEGFRGVLFGIPGLTVGRVPFKSTKSRWPFLLHGNPWAVWQSLFAWHGTLPELVFGAETKHTARCSLGWELQGKPTEEEENEGLSFFWGFGGQNAGGSPFTFQTTLKKSTSLSNHTQERQFCFWLPFQTTQKCTFPLGFPFKPRKKYTFPRGFPFNPHQNMRRQLQKHDKPLPSQLETSSSTWVPSVVARRIAPELRSSQ